MKNENYLVIQGWMINELKLKGNELLLYALIYGFSQDGESEFYGSLRYTQKLLGLSRPSIIKNIQKLVGKKLIEKKSESHYKVVKKVYQGGKESLPLGGKESLPNKYNTNNNISKEIEAKASRREDIDLLIKEITSVVGMLDESQRQQRNFARHFIDSKMPKIYNEELKREEFTRQDIINGIKRIFQIAKQDKFHSKNCRRISYVYRNSLSIIQSKLNNKPKVAIIPNN